MSETVYRRRAENDPIQDAAIDDLLTSGALQAFRADELRYVMEIPGDPDPCEHGNYAPHIVPGGIVPKGDQWRDEHGRVMCEGKNDEPDL